MTPKDLVDFHNWFQSSFYHLLGKRAPTMYQALMIAVARNARTFVETGTARTANNWQGDGQSTIVFGSFCQRFNGRLWTCDLLEQAITQSRAASAPLKSHIEYVVSDSVEFLKNFDKPIDFLYLDSYDFPLDGSDHHPSQDHSVREAMAALPHLHNQSIIMIDDCGPPLLHGGKGGKVVPFLIGQGWQVVGLNYQILMTRVLPPGA